jgi:hypothetical protein
MNEKKKKPDLVVWDELNGYHANIKAYPTNIGAPSFELPNVSMARSEASKKMSDVFERERQEIIERIEKLYNEYDTSVMVWESKISFEPIIGKTYYLYDFDNVKTLSLLSPKEWNKSDRFIGEFTLTSDRKWIKI